MHTNVLFWASGALVGLGGLTLLAWALFADRSRGRGRCPKCWYDMSQTAKSPDGRGWRCPECGREINKERRLFRTRRRWKWALASLLVFASAGYLAVQPTVREGGWASVSPATVMILALDLDDPQWALEGLHDRIRTDVSNISSGFSGMLVTDRRALWPWQWRLMAVRCGRIARASEYSTTTRLQALSFLSDAEAILCEAGKDTASLRAAISVLLTDADPLLRGQAAARCAHRDTPEESFRQIAPLLHDPDATVRQWATTGMRFLSLESDVAVPLLIEAIDDPARKVRLGALGALGTCGGRGQPYPDVFARLRELALHDSDPAVREYALKVLAKFSAHRDEALLFIREATRSPDDALRSGAFQAIWCFDPENNGENEDDPLVQTVIRGLSDSNQDVRQSAAEYLERQLSADQITPFAASLESLRRSDDPTVAMSVIRALSSLPSVDTEATSPAPQS